MPETPDALLETYPALLERYGTKALVEDFGARAKMFVPRKRIPPADWPRFLDGCRCRGLVLRPDALQRAEIHYQHAKSEPPLPLEDPRP